MIEIKGLGLARFSFQRKPSLLATLALLQTGITRYRFPDSSVFHSLEIVGKNLLKGLSHSEMMLGLSSPGAIKLQE